MSKYPWTPGPWRVVRWTDNYGPRSQVMAPPTRDDGPETPITQAWRESSADPDLIALAPEMATAILAWAADNNPLSDEYETESDLRRIAMKLRAINKKSTS